MQDLLVARAELNIMMEMYSQLEMKNISQTDQVYLLTLTLSLSFTFTFNILIHNLPDTV